MFILKILITPQSSIVKVKLPRPNLKIDSRPNNLRNWRFKCIYNTGGSGSSVTLIRTDSDQEWDSTLELRAYDPAVEAVPDFESTVYTYEGIEGEQAPIDTTLAIVDPSVHTIKQWAFSGCTKMKTCIMHDGVQVIEFRAFSDCKAMKAVRLSRSLKHIGRRAFYHCESIRAFFLPSTVSEIEDEAFSHCKSLQILTLPRHTSMNMERMRMGEEIMCGCDAFFDTTKIQQYEYDHRAMVTNSDTVHQSIIDFYHTNIPPLHKVSMGTDITTQKINECIAGYGTDEMTTMTSVTDHNGMTALHILALNPHATSGSVAACFYKNVNTVFVHDASGKSPLDYLKEHDNAESYIMLLACLCLYRNATI